MRDVVVYRILSDTGAPDINVSAGVAIALCDMGIIHHSVEDYQVIREGETTVTIYTHRKV